MKTQAKSTQVHTSLKSDDLIPTRYKEKLPKDWSYPLGAEIITKRLNGIELSDPFDIWFQWRAEFWYSKFQENVKGLGDIVILECRSSLFHSGLTLYLYALPSTIKKNVRESLDHDVFPKLFEWLLNYKKGAVFSVLLNLKTEKVSVKN